MKKRLRKKKEPQEWGSIPLTCDDDVDYVPGVEGSPDGPERRINVVFWRTDRQRIRESGGGPRSVATYQEYDDAEVSNGTILVGRLHFTAGRISDETVVHECVHAARHGERIMESDDEERVAYRTQRLFRAVQDFMDKTAS